MFDWLLPDDLTQAQHDGITVVLAVILATMFGVVVHRIVLDVLIRPARKRELVFAPIVERSQRPAAFHRSAAGALAKEPRRVERRLSANRNAVVESLTGRIEAITATSPWWRFGIGAA